MQEKADCMIREKGDKMSRADKAFIQTFASKKDMSKEKAKEMLKDKTAHGKPLTEQQKKMLYAKANE